jgi:type II secretory ATPase GspE/PulE/Tfp pilus assembly ATPase PilB-like protein
MKIDEKRLPQDGRFNFEANGQEVDLRVSCLPTVHGEKIVM